VPSLDSVRFDTAGLRFQGEREQMQVWYTPAGDGIGLYYFPLKPDIGASLQSLDSVRDFYRSTATASGAAIIEVDIVSADGCLAVRQIIKVPQQPHGMTYLGSITLPFQDFSFVLKVQCQERGVTGVRDTMVMHEALSDGRVRIAPEPRELRGWMQDPYDPTLREGFHRNLSESEDYDARFPDHPLSRLRPLLARLQHTVRIETEVRGAHPYSFGS
jgi:hypothetical protein